MSRDCDGYIKPPTKYDRFSDWCLRHEEVFGFVRTVCAVIGTVAVTILLILQLTENLK